ncbi:spore germination protein GerM [Gottschalkia purinilytica]|uniref:Spore germination protein GerM n=1 Tax=Gottschalkia purinilytica TaxID=1503 RepID=A0A0L0W6Y3_GOTPU|nr:GerMN domain-containing protein [Gottschalkia purinilytica]KNF07232.1 spore germination protein GerM [Gottschalkia purinilytica]
MKHKKIIGIILTILLSLLLYGCNKIDQIRGIIFEEKGDIEIIRNDEEEINASIETNLRDTTLYYQNENGYLVPIKRQIPWEEGIAKAALKNMTDTVAVREDINPIGLKPIIPTGTEIRGMTVDNETGICKIDFSKEIENYEGKKQEENMIKGIVYTLTEFPNIKEVQIIIDGKAVTTMKHGTNIEKPLKREDINLIEVSGNTDSKMVVYYKGTGSGEYEYYVPVTIPVSSHKNNILTALGYLFKGAPELSGLYTDIPDGVKLQQAQVSDGTIYVDVKLDNENSIKDQVAFDKMSKNISLTLSQFENVKNIEVLVDGKTLQEAGLPLEGQGTAIPVFANEY